MGQPLDVGFAQKIAERPDDIPLSFFLRVGPVENRGHAVQLYPNAGTTPFSELGSQTRQQGLDIAPRDVRAHGIRKDAVRVRDCLEVKINLPFLPAVSISIAN
jgi:hypothetical protein